jgi:hypothetical protein
MGRQWVPIGGAWEERTARVRLYGSGVEAKGERNKVHI